MIVYLSGTPLVIGEFTAIVVNGVGYGVHLTQNSKSKIQNEKTVELFVYSHIREDAFDLYGFLSTEERMLFLKLIDVDGVGPKTALAIMDRGVKAIILAVQAADVSFFQGVPRVGKKSAQKIIIELKSKLGGDELTLTEPVGKEKEAVDALVSLGFSQSESQKVIHAFDTNAMRTEDMVKGAIRELTSNK